MTYGAELSATVPLYVILTPEAGVPSCFSAALALKVTVLRPAAKGACPIASLTGILA